MLEQATLARDRAYAPYSHFHVGCCIKTTNNEFFTGFNIENVSYSLTLCAEATAIAAMITAGQKHIAEITIISSGKDICSPCGACRQRIREFASPEALIHMFSASGEQQTNTLAELLPFSFGPQHLEPITNEN
jgi:cytidine deaminase